MSLCALLATTLAFEGLHLPFFPATGRVPHFNVTVISNSQKSVSPGTPCCDTSSATLQSQCSVQRFNPAWRLCFSYSWRECSHLWISRSPQSLLSCITVVCIYICSLIQLWTFWERTAKKMTSRMQSDILLYPILSYDSPVQSTNHAWPSTCTLNNARYYKTRLPKMADFSGLKKFIF
jgi:hypothetical protein